MWLFNKKKNVKNTNVSVVTEPLFSEELLKWRPVTKSLNLGRAKVKLRFASGKEIVTGIAGYFYADPELRPLTYDMYSSNKKLGLKYCPPAYARIDKYTVLNQYNLQYLLVNKSSINLDLVEEWELLQDSIEENLVEYTDYELKNQNEGESLQ